MKIVQWKIFIQGVDVSEDVEEIQAIQNQLDVPRLTEYAVSDVTLVLMPNRYDYSPDKATNFFTQHPLKPTDVDAQGNPTTRGKQSGYRSSIEIQGGFRNQEDSFETRFTGMVVELTHNVTGQGYRIVATDKSIDLRTDTITDFGLRKNNNIVSAPQQATVRGEFNFAEAVTPVSEGSVSGTLGGQALVETQNFANEGELDELNFQLTQDGATLLTEIAPDSATTNLNATYKAPLRGVGLDRTIRNILEKYEIENPPSAQLPLMQSPTPHWSHISRPAYEIESKDGTNRVPFGWNGYITDMVVQASTGDIFALYTHRGHTIQPHLLKYDASADTWSSIYQASAHAEWWQLATADFNEFFILQTTATYQNRLPTAGSYNPSEGSAQTSILKRNVSAGSLAVFANSGNLRPQAAVHYWYGFIKGTGRPRSNNPRFGFLPDSRTGFEVANNHVWYRFASSAQFGLAKIPTSAGSNQTGTAEIEIPRDAFANEASFDFTIDGSTVYASHTTIGESGGNLRSRHLVYSKSI